MSGDAILSDHVSVHSSCPSLVTVTLPPYPHCWVCPICHTLNCTFYYPEFYKVCPLFSNVSVPEGPPLSYTHTCAQEEESNPLSSGSELASGGEEDEDEKTLDFSDGDQSRPDSADDF